MRFVHIIARLKEEVKVVDKTLADIYDMIEGIENVGGGFWKPGERPMWSMLCSLEDKVRNEYHVLNSKITGYEYKALMGVLGGMK